MRPLLACALAAALLAGPALAQPTATPPAERPAPRWSRAEAEAALNALTTALDHYVFPDGVARAKAALRAGWSRYASLEGPDVFGETLTREIGAALDDKHFYVRRGGPAPRMGAPPSDAETGYGIAAVRRLPGNVGYIDLRLLSPAPEAVARLEAAMDLVQDTGALIIDLRGNLGGGGAALDTMVGRLAATPIPRSALLWRRPDGGFDRMEPENTAYPEAKRYARPVYLLTSGVTISAAEAFAYDLQQAGRATVVGGVTRGGGNPMNRPPFDLGSGLRAYVATGRSEHPVTKGTPNGTGVQPDVAAPAETALAVAYARALQDVPATPGTRLARELEAARQDPAAALQRSLTPS